MFFGGKIQEVQVIKHGVILGTYSIVSIITALGCGPRLKKQAG